MPLPSLLPADRLAEARRHLLESGEVPPGLVRDDLARSWLRSQQAGLSPTDTLAATPLSSASQLRQALSVESDFLAHARPVMEFVHEQIRDSGSMVVLADARGLLLHSLGDADFLARAERVSLHPGALWLEEHRGTNGIGTALAEGRAVAVQGGEHYLERNSFLTCAAAPVVAPDGRVRGAIDISGDQRHHHPHTLALVRSAARMIEDRLFHARHPQNLLLRLHPRAEGLGSVGEGLLAISEDGWIMGANPIAQQWLGLSAAQIGATTLDRVLGPHALRLQSLPATGLHLFVRDEPERRRRVWATVNPTKARPASDAAQAPLQPRPPRPRGTHDDPRVLLAMQRALKVQAQGVPVLLQGESGTGKEVFARTLHADGERAAGPFIAVSCAALSESLVEVALFGCIGGPPGRIRQAEGGTLFLDDIGELPHALQARLLRVLQDREVLPVGGCAPVPVDVVLVCATHTQLREAVARGEFREDLYWRLNGLTVQMPPLRERGDLIELIDDMLHGLAHDMKRTRAPSLADEVTQALGQHPWPGNLRQLQAALRTACALLGPHDEELDWEHFSEDLWDDVFSKPYREDPEPVTPVVLGGEMARADLLMPEEADTNLRRLSSRAIRAAGGNMSEAARRLGISRNTLYRRLKQAKTGRAA